MPSARGAATLVRAKVRSVLTGQVLEMTFKSGDKMKEDPDVYTWIFKKIDGQWKVIYSHESGVPVMQKATTK